MEENHKIVINRGEDKQVEFAFFTFDDQPVDLLGSDIEMRIFSISGNQSVIRSPNISLLNANTVLVHFSHDAPFDNSVQYRYEIFQIKPEGSTDCHTLLDVGKIAIVGGRYE